MYFYFSMFKFIVLHMCILQFYGQPIGVGQHGAFREFMENLAVRRLLDDLGNPTRNLVH